MSDWPRRDFLKTTAAASLAPALPAAALAPRSLGSFSAAEAAPAADLASPRRRELLDFGWHFHFGNADQPELDFGFGSGEAYAKTGRLFTPCRPDFSIADWEAVDLPHDWAVSLPFINDPALASFGFKPLGRKYPATSIGWYRRVFEVPAAARGQRLALEFDGVFRDSIAVLNGNYLGRSMSGYAPFRYDITDCAFYGRPNVLVLRVNATEREGWFYEGAGIYRHVWLVQTDPLHIAPQGLYVTAQPDASHQRAAVAMATELNNDQDAAVRCRVISVIADAQGREVLHLRSQPVTLAPWSQRTLRQVAALDHPSLWSPDHPALYRLTNRVETDAGEADREETPFGVRSLRFTADQGFFLNGQRTEIHGTCNHQDHAGVGVAVPDRVQYYRVERLKAMGANAYRTSHNPPTPAVLDACDRLGMMVMDETRMFSSEPEGLSQLARLVRRDRNRACVVLWSIGNEEPEQGTPRGARIAASMKRLVRRLDATRPVTEAMNYGWGYGLSEVVDVQGFNYGLGPRIDAYHRKFPQKPCFGSEVASTFSTRGIYRYVPLAGWLSAYDVNNPSWGATAEEWWNVYADRAYLAGGFVWTGFDYRGEPTPYAWPCISSQFGILDTCGFPKDNFYYYQAWWTERPVLHILPHWNWQGQEGRPIAVWCHTNLERVELFLNGKSLGARRVPRNRHVQLSVPFAPGALEARGYRGGKLVMTARRETTGPATAVHLSPDRTALAADGQDASVVAVSLQDAQGRVVPTADDAVSFALSGSGRIIGVGNGDPSSHEADKPDPKSAGLAAGRHAFNGWCCAIVQSRHRQPGAITLTASAKGLAPATATLTSS
ncbi:MAG: beta-galactosidase GalA [Terriglobales bacterium]